MREEWQQITEYKGLYEVSNMGQVRSLPRNTTSGKLLKFKTDTNGYYRVSLSKNGTVKNHFVHRLVALAFVKGFSDQNNIVNHKNEDKKDNRASNLEWCDMKYNTNYNGACFRRANWCRKPVIAIKQSKVTRFNSITEASKALNIPHGNISNVLQGRRKTASGYTFKYAKA